jgi:Protein of unknown function (DUF3141)
MHYLGGLLGGAWLASLAGDLGDGIFDGASLDHPDYTLWTKDYHLYGNIDTEPQ